MSIISQMQDLTCPADNITLTADSCLDEDGIPYEDYGIRCASYFAKLAQELNNQESKIQWEEGNLISDFQAKYFPLFRLVIKTFSV